MLDLSSRSIWEKPAYGVSDLAKTRCKSLATAEAELAVLPAESVRAKLYALQKETAQLPKIECPLQHVFAPGAYARTIFVPKGSVIIGKIHKHSHLNILSEGCASIMTEEGGVQHLEGPYTMVSPPGTKRGVFAHTDLVWTTIHLTHETELEKIEAEVIADTYAEYEEWRKLEKNDMKHIEVSA